MSQDSKSSENLNFPGKDTPGTVQLESADKTMGKSIPRDPIVYEDPPWYRTFWYDGFLLLMSAIFHCFFREIRTRGAFRIPRGRTPVKGDDEDASNMLYRGGDDPIIFVAAPHANQFIDPIVLMGRVKHAINKRVSFLIAAKSLTRPAVGTFARFMMSIGVARPQDNLKTVSSGKVTVDPNDSLILIGDDDCDFTKFKSKGLIGLPKSMGSANIDKIISKNKIQLKKEFKMSKPEVARILSEGTSIKYADPIDQSEVYDKVFERLHHGQCVGMFPEGGSHDRPHLLALKPGVAIMALGAMAKYDKLNVKIVCCGMNYFNAHKFRSRAVVEFGFPIEITKELLDKYKNPSTMKEAVQELMEEITHGLKSVTINCPDYETLMAVQATRRLYLGNLHNRMPLQVIIEMNRKLVKGYDIFKDDIRVINLKKKVLDYNAELTHLNIPDHLVGTMDEYNNWFKNIQILVVRSLKIVILLILSLPGYIMFSPVFLLAKRISVQKAKEALAGSTVKIKANDVIATWKVLISMGVAPILYCFWSILLSHICCVKLEGEFNGVKLTKLRLFPIFYLFSCIVTYCALIFDYGVENFKSLRPIFLLLKNPDGIKKLEEKRKILSMEITEIVNELGPKVFDDFDHDSIKDSYYSETGAEADASKLAQPFISQRVSGEDNSHTSGYESDGMSMLNGESMSISHIPIFSERSRSGSAISLKDLSAREEETEDTTFEIIEPSDFQIETKSDVACETAGSKGSKSGGLGNKILKRIRSKRREHKD